MQKYAFLLKDARNYWKMFEGEGDKKKNENFFLKLIKIKKEILIVYKMEET